MRRCFDYYSDVTDIWDNEGLVPWFQRRVPLCPIHFAPLELALVELAP